MNELGDLAPAIGGMALLIWGLIYAHWILPRPPKSRRTKTTSNEQ